jgi:transcriptional regulator with XRE-family HTH domain
MFTEPNFLRKFRKKTDITQSDIGFLMNLPDYSAISRCENGERKAGLQMLFLYNMLFDVPINSLFEIQKDNLNEDLIVRIGLLIKELSLTEATPKVKGRIAFLSSTLTKLTA